VPVVPTVSGFACFPNLASSTTVLRDRYSISIGFYSQLLLLEERSIGSYQYELSLYNSYKVKGYSLPSDTFPFSLQPNFSKFFQSLLRSGYAFLVAAQCRKSMTGYLPILVYLTKSLTDRNTIKWSVKESAVYFVHYSVKRLNKYPEKEAAK